MDRITVNEFIEEVKNDHSPLKEGHDLGLIIDDSKGDPSLIKNLLSTIAARATCVTVDIEELRDPLGLKGALKGSGVEDPLVFVHVNEPLLPRHHEALQSLVYHHALEAWDYRHTAGELVSFPEASRFVLVISRGALEASWKAYPSLKGILGATISCDAARKEGV